MNIHYFYIYIQALQICNKNSHGQEFTLTPIQTSLFIQIYAITIRVVLNLNVCNFWEITIPKQQMHKLKAVRQTLINISSLRDESQG